MTYPTQLVVFFRDQQALALGILLALVLGTVISKKESTRLLFGALIVAYAVVAFLVASTLLVHGVRR